MPRYKYTGDTRVRVVDAVVEVDPGEEFDCEVELNNPFLVRVDGDQPNPEPAPEPEPEPEQPHEEDAS